ncbi:cache domain-containing protein [Noviherbaspirillum galbum]|uniref:Histidine kinase n=1 Tax=Noviherbaspirillum galbum TaxID=2709383 RepID=A0A6B3SIC9_9BURK|nr:cache domain-containing protein [Noviherbaspirillum galbum]NEX60443.1 histidine kinase [Noviherbaspirillum galbum]
MKKFIGIASLAIAGFIAAAPSCVVAANDKGTPEEATALVKKVIAYYKANGPEKTFAAINAQNPDFKAKDMYIFGGWAKDGQPLLSHGANPKMVGKEMSALKDADGKPFAKEIVDVAQKQGKGWVDYKWPNPVTKVIEAKSTYVERVDDYYFACGIYK